jgi:hypothetical protein
MFDDIIYEKKKSEDEENPDCLWNDGYERHRYEDLNVLEDLLHQQYDYE